SADPSIPSAAPAASAAAADTAVPGSGTQAPASTSEKVQVKTDVYNLTFDTQGAQLVKAELVKYSAPGAKDEPMVLLDNSAQSVYMAQTGVVGAPAGQSYPTHLTPFRLVSTDTALAGDTLKVVFEA